MQIEIQESPVQQAHAQTRTASLIRLQSVLAPLCYKALPKAGLLLLYLLATIQFVGSYLYLEYPYVNIHLWERGYAPLPFQARLLLAPLYRWTDTNTWAIHYTSNLARNHYFFPHGIGPDMVLEFVIGIVCVLFSGWVALRIYDVATQHKLLRPLVYPLFLGLCTMAYVVHTVQNFRYVYDMPSLAAFALGFYLIYFRKSVLWFILLFTIATLNRETTLLLLPFWAVSQAMGLNGRLCWRTLVSRRVLLVAVPLALYWALWHHVVYSIFSGNASEYYSRLLFNLHCFIRLRYWPQLASAFGFLWPFLILYRSRLRDAQLRGWLLVLPLWYGFMLLWAIVTETRVFGELLTFVAPTAVIMAEEVLASRMQRRDLFYEEEMAIRPKSSRRAA